MSRTFVFWLLFAPVIQLWADFPYIAPVTLHKIQTM